MLAKSRQGIKKRKVTPEKRVRKWWSRKRRLARIKPTATLRIIGRMAALTTVIIGDV
jgi:hypothetical protein